jgi:hypothetical protein
MDRLLKTIFHMRGWLMFSWHPKDGGFCNHGSHNIWIHVWSMPSVLKAPLSFLLCVAANMKDSLRLASNTLSIAQDVMKLLQDIFLCVAARNCFNFLLPIWKYLYKLFRVIQWVSALSLLHKLKCVLYASDQAFQLLSWWLHSLSIENVKDFQEQDKNNNQEGGIK